MKEIIVNRVLNKHKRDPWFLDEYTLNPYTSCAFNCLYCYTHSERWGNREPAVKINAPTVLAKELQKLAKEKKYGFIGISSATDAWQPAEEKYEVTRKCLQVIKRCRFPIHACTKSKLIVRDIELLKSMKNAILPPDLKDLDGVLVSFSFSTLKEKIARIFEPGAPSPEERLETLKKMKKEGFMCGIAFIPLLPFERTV